MPNGMELYEQSAEYSCKYVSLGFDRELHSVQGVVTERNCEG